MTCVRQKNMEKYETEWDEQPWEREPGFFLLLL